MKKIVCLALIFAMLCLPVVASAATNGTSSITINDEITVEVDEDGPWIKGIPDDETALDEVQTLLAAPDLNTYFAQDMTALPGMEQGKAVDVLDFFALEAGGWEVDGNDVTARFLFTVPVEKDQKVVLMAGKITAETEDTRTIEWTPYEGIGIGDNKVEVHFPREQVLDIQNGHYLGALIG